MGRRDVREGSGAKVSRRVMLGQGHAVDARLARMRGVFWFQAVLSCTYYVNLFFYESLYCLYADLCV